MFGKQRLGIDLGTVNTIIYIDNKGIALREPSVVAVNKQTDEVVAFGRTALELAGRTSNTYEIVRPMRDGVIANFSMTKLMLAHYINQALRRSLRSPEVVICVPSNITKVERRAMIDTLRELGIRRAMIVDEPMAAAIGANLAVQQAKGRMVVDIGGGTTDVATISYGEIIADYTSPAAGNRMNAVIQDYVREYYGLVISSQLAEDLKLTIGSAAYSPAEDSQDYMEVMGRNAKTNLPDRALVTAELVSKAINEVILEIVIAIRQVLEVTKPELAADILESGIVLTGGGAQLKRLSERLHQEIGTPVNLAQQPMDAVAIGAGRMIKDIDIYTREAQKDF